MDWKNLGVFATLLAVFVTMWWQLDCKIEYEISALRVASWSAKSPLWTARLTSSLLPLDEQPDCAELRHRRTSMARPTPTLPLTREMHHYV